MTVSLRVPTPADAEVLADLLRRNRDHFRTAEPARPDEYYTAQHQADVLGAAERARSEGSGYLFLIDADGEVVGRAALSSVIRGAFQSASVSYVVDERATGRGVAKAALRGLIDVAFSELGLHRLQGETLVDNVASQRVLEACGFKHYGTAPDYLRIDGCWQTHRLYQLINPASPC